MTETVINLTGQGYEEIREVRRMLGSPVSPCLCYNFLMTRKKLDYLIKLTYDKDYQGYVADVVNLYGCMSQGKTKKEALANVKKAIQAYMQTIATSGRNAEFTKKTVDVIIPSLSVNA